MLCLLIFALLPLPILDARIKAYRRHLASSNLTSADRVTLTQSLTFHLRERYKILEEVDDDSDLLYPP